MKKYSFFTKAVLLTAVMGLSMASCSNDELSENGGGNVAPKELEDNVIGYAVNIDNAGGTRGTATTLTSFETTGNTFMVWGYYANGATGTGVTEGALYVGTSNTVGTIIERGATAWDYQTAADKKIWPAATGTLNFQAVSPYDYGTVINTPAENVANVGMTITVPVAVADQKDLVFGHAENKTYASNASVVPLAFEHALSQIVFQGKVNATGLTATIKGVKVCNIKNTADVGYLGARFVDDNGTAADPSDDVTTDRRVLAVQNIAATTSKYPIGMNGGSDVILTTTTATDLCDASGALMMVPQSGATAWTTAPGAPVTIATADTNGETYLEIECKIKYTDNADYILGSADTYGKVYLPFTVAWEIGKKYTYVLNFGTGNGGYDENGEGMMNFISYSVVSVTDWNEVAGAEHTI